MNKRHWINALAIIRLRNLRKKEKVKGEREKKQKEEGGQRRREERQGTRWLKKKLVASIKYESYSKTKQKKI